MIAYIVERDRTGAKDTRAVKARKIENYTEDSEEVCQKIINFEILLIDN